MFNLVLRRNPLKCYMLTFLQKICLLCFFSQIDSDDIEAEQEGPPSVKIQKTTATPTTSSSTKRKLQTFSFGQQKFQAADDDHGASTSTGVKTTEVPSPGKNLLKRKGESLRQQSLSAFVPKKITLGQKAKIDEAFSKLFTKDFQPFSIVEDEGFVAYSNALNPSYVIPDRKTITKSIIPAKYEECLLNTKNMIEKAVSVCLTTDCWTSRNTDSFMGVTAHFISDDFSLTSVVLQCEQFPLSHTSMNLSDSLRSISQVWNIGDKITLVVSDNASNVTKAIKDILGWKHLGCFAHSLNLVVKNGLKANQNILCLVENVRKIVSHFKRSTNATAKLLTYQKQNNDPKNAPKKLVQDVPTRWNSTFLMIKRFLLLHEPLKATLALIDKDLPTLTQNDWKMACELMLCLKPFFAVTESVSGEKYATASLIIPLVNSLISVCEKLAAKQFSPDVHEVAEKLLKEVNERFGNLENSQTLTLVTFMDPRFKNLCFSRPEIGERVKQRVVNMVTSQIVNSLGKDQGTSSQETLETTVKATDELSVFTNLDARLSKQKKKGTNMSRAIIEIDRYLEDENLDRKDDPLVWWKTEGQQYPHLRGIYKKYGCCLATSVPSERVFSKAGIVINERRNRLTGNKANMLVFLNQNLPGKKENKNSHCDRVVQNNMNAYNEEEFLTKIVQKLAPNI